MSDALSDIRRFRGVQEDPGPGSWSSSPGGGTRRCRRRRRDAGGGGRFDASGGRRKARVRAPGPPPSPQAGCSGQPGQPGPSRLSRLGVENQPCNCASETLKADWQACRDQ